MVEPICALPPLSESLRDSQGASSVQHWTVIDGMRGPHWGIGLIIYVLCNRWGERNIVNRSSTLEFFISNLLNI